MKHRHKTHTAGYNPRILSENTSSILLKSPSILSKLRVSSAQCTLSDKLLVPPTSKATWYNQSGKRILGIHLWTTRRDPGIDN